MNVVGDAAKDTNQYTGQDYDAESNTEHFLYRQYSSTQGRWMSPDPYDGSYKFIDPQSLNRYAYIFNNPLGATDRTGLATFFCNPDDFCDGGGGGGGYAWGASWNEFYTPNPNYEADYYRQWGTAEEKAAQASIDSARAAAIAAQKQAEISAAYMVACGHSVEGCVSDQAVVVRYVGFTYNVQIPGDGFDITELNPPYLQDPGVTNAIFHGGKGVDSFYLSSGLGLASANVPHVIADLNSIEAHIDNFGPANPLHWGESILSLFINTRASAGTGSFQTCSPVGGCH